MFREIEDPKEAYEFHKAGLLWCILKHTAGEVPHPCVPQWTLDGMTRTDMWHWLICVEA